MNTVEEGRHFVAGTIPAVKNLNEKLKESYPEGFLERSKSNKSAKKSSRKSVKISESRKKGS